MPLSAAQFARGLRRSARELVAEPALAPAGIGQQAPQPPTRRYVQWRFGGQGARSVARFSVRRAWALQKLNLLADAAGGRAHVASWLGALFVAMVAVNVIGLVVTVVVVLLAVVPLAVVPRASRVVAGVVARAFGLRP